MPSVKDSLHPNAPALVKASGPKDGEEAGPVNRVEGFTEVNFEDNGGGLSVMTASKQVRRIDDVLGDVPTREEARLVRVNKRMDSRLESRCEHFCNGFHNAVLEGNGAELGGMRGGISLWK